MSEEVGLRDETGERKYFTTVPNIVDDLTATPHDAAVYRAMLRCAGGSGKVCYASTRRIAEIAKVSVGQVSRSKQALLDLEFIAFDGRHSVGNSGQPIDHYRLPDLWPRNMKHFAEIQERSLHEHSKRSPDEQERSPDEHKCSPSERKKGSSRKESVVETSTSAEPRARNEQTFPPEDYRVVEAAYTRITGIQPQGREWQPIQQACKTMFMSGRTPDQIIALMEAFEASDAEWTANWRMDTVRLKLPEYLAGHLDLGGNGNRPRRPGTSRGKAYYLEQEP